MATRERPTIHGNVYETTTKTEAFLAFLDYFMQEHGPDCENAEVLAELRRRANLLRNAGWSNYRSRTR